ncbi:ABC transporter substrate-binding protein [Galbitalea soli]|uniref:Carbohydrate ABC transporter substrate-binding protein n=1 Tax=Galbitalea soli TaxID=1268042 RepID=A0A7C9PMT8_9MICO|nr:ABC transporter substrate-binding protein [Galbitalea soli]NEM91047.1 carbohydrate ABC transporter substrate-binding protein [Galbitalea soli]NYJ29735.1 alpha-glucoside transport system substrate-binding protein [Galbitalea soli]
MRLRNKTIASVAALVGAAVVLSGCSGTSGGGGNTTVQILGAFTAAQATAFQADLTKWGKANNITVKYSGSDNFQQAIVTRVTAGNPPDVAIYPQPGVLKQQVKDLKPLDSLGVDVASVTSDEPNGLGDIGNVNGKTYGLPYSINVKSLVWYDPAAFAAHGYTVPTTDEELTALEAKIKSDGAGYPWCVGAESGAATGWPMTDWLEEYVLRYGGLDQYNKWITHDVLFNSDLVKKAAAKVQSEILDPGQVNGGGKAIATTNFGKAGNQLFVSGKDKGQCFMMRQGTFIADFFPDNIKAEIAKKDTTNINVFPLPTPSDAVTSGTLGGGDLVGAFNTNAATKKVVQYLVSKEFGTNGYAGQAIFLSPHTSFDSSLYTSPFQAAAQKAVAASKVFGFDASDQMPGAVGAGTEWTDLTAWTTGQKTLDAVLQDIDSSWPKS